MTLRFRPEAEDEYLQAVSWYEEQRVHLRRNPTNWSRREG